MTGGAETRDVGAGSEEDSGRAPRLARFVDLAEQVVYYAAAIFLLVTVGMVFFSAVTSLLMVAEAGSLYTALEVLDKVLLIFIFAELLATVSTIVPTKPHSAHSDQANAKDREGKGFGNRDCSHGETLGIACYNNRGARRQSENLHL